MTTPVRPECRIETQRFFLRPLEISDASDAYLSWFKEPDVSRFIAAALSNPSHDDLEDYIASRMNRRDVLFMGIFLRDTREHIGNIKFEPLNESEGYAILGILLGTPKWRGKGVAKEVITASANWLARYRHVRKIYLGVDRRNHAAIQAYEKIGFHETRSGEVLTSSASNLAMVLLLSSPLKPVSHP